MPDQFHQIDLKSILLFAIFQVVLLGANQLRLMQKRKGKTDDLDSEKDSLVIRQGAVALDAFDILKAEKQELKQQLDAIIASDIKLEEKHQKILAQVADYDAVKTERDLALAKVDIIKDIADRLSINLSLNKKEE